MFDKLFPILGLVWVLGVFVWVIKDNKWIGVYQCLMILISSLLWVFGEQLGFDGGLASLCFIAISVALFFFVKKARDSRK